VDGLLARVPPRASLPAIVRNVRRIATVVSDPAARVEKLGEAITDDPALSAETLRLANTVGVGSGASRDRRVTTVRQAIMLLGFDRLRDVAVGSAVFGMVDGHEPELAVLTGGAVLTAHHAMVAALMLEHPRPETAYLAGLLRNLGEMAAARWLPKAYREYRRALAEGLLPTMAARQTLGATRDELGRALIQHWGLPEPIRAAMGRKGHGAPSIGGDASLAPITSFAARLTDAVYRAEPPAESAWDATYEAADALGIPAARIPQVLSLAFPEAEDVLTALRPDLPLDAWRARYERAVDDDSPIRFGRPLTSGGDARAATAPDRLLPLSDEHDADDGAGLRLRDGAAPTVDRVLQVVGDAPDTLVPPRTAAQADADAIAEAIAGLLDAGFQRAALLLLDAASDTLRVRDADGDGAEFLAQRLDVPRAGRTPLSVAFRYQRDLVLLSRAALATLEEPTFKALRSVAAVWLPVRVSGVAIGALFGDALRSGLVSDASGPAAVAARDALEQEMAAIRARAPKKG
jgi:HD-like signal output (HDOD) protein